MFCLNCKKETLNPKYCSRSCSATQTNKIPKRKLERICTRCTNTVKSYRSVLCAEHFQEEQDSYILNKSLEEIQNRLSVKGKHPSWLSAAIRVHNRRYNKVFLTKPCANCGYSKHVELCHKKAVADFPKSALLRIVNHPSNIIQLCRNCHWEFDNGLLII